MLSINNKNDLIKLETMNTHPLIKRYLKDYLNQMMFRFQTEDISEYGNIVYLETLAEAELYKDEQPDFVTRIALNDGISAVDISQSIYRQNNKMLVVFAEPTILEPLIKKQYCA